ncbi:ABC transporter permease subunit [Paenibacillus sp. WQ 127069]|uniref:ABC transporter permease subunit n=1 Tax=Paenibacillus baimaensis TaxID=2982185 RepID=A0ABT2UD61_9BACL|nr:ABC transporter permease subunit [Paenibacillus sp. WQ 127069]MCU6792535.1 ABC transporter permease subunit [Paenibacillus sp. WQ 127069]
MASKIWRNYQLYLFLLPTLIYFFIFSYIPMYGVTIAFKEFKPHLGILGSPWVGFEHFERFFRSDQFWSLIQNTLGLSIYQLAAGFPLPIILAILLNYAKFHRLKKTVQTMTYVPHFISTVVLVGMMSVLLSPQLGIVNVIIKSLGSDPVLFMADEDWFRSVYVWSGVWQNAGWGTIIYLAALAGIDPGLHEAAIVDGASKLRRIWHVDLPGIAPTIMILLILNMGSIMAVGFEKTFLMQNALNLATSEVISTYVYKVGLLSSQYSFAATVGLFNSVINFMLLIIVNRTAKAFGQNSLW